MISQPCPLEIKGSASSSVSPLNLLEGIKGSALPLSEPDDSSEVVQMHKAL